MLVEKVIQDWLKDIKYNKPIMIQKIYSSDPKTIKIFTKNPRWFIGKGGTGYCGMEHLVSIATGNDVLFVERRC